MPSKPISQKRWVKGLSPTTGLLTQSPVTLQRLKNLLLTQRGSLITCDGSSTIGTVSAINPLIVSIGVFNDLTAGIYPFYVVFSINPSATSNNLQLYTGSPGNPATTVVFVLVTAAVYTVPKLIPAALAPGDPNFSAAGSVITNYNPSSTTGTLTVTVNAPNPSNSGTLNFSGWTSLALTSGNAVTASVNFNTSISQTGGLASGATTSINYSVDGGVTFINAYNVDGSGSFAITFPITATLTNLNLLVVQIATIIHLGTSSSATITANITNIYASVSKASTLSPYGGVASQACLIPQSLQFTSTTVLILGNGLAPQTIDVTVGATAVPANLTNTFTANYPNWQASVGWSKGDQIGVLISGTTYLFTATQGGVSGSSTPTFSAVLGSTVTDHQVIWQNSGTVSTSPAPRGAAHGIVYAGSLWLANTSPQTTSDNLDGPCVLKMSDTNNPQSWNPLNVAFLGRDDGTQITGLASFTIAEAGIAPTGSLVVFKEFSTYQIFGVFGATDFQITQAQTDLGCIGPRTIQFLPGFGITRLTHLGFAVFDGVRDKLISEEIRPYIFGGTLQQADITGIDFSFAYFAKGTQSTAPPMYFCIAPLTGASGTMTRIFCYDLVLKAWAVIDLPWPVSALTSIRTGEGKPLLLAGRSDNGAVERLQSGDTQWDTAGNKTPISWAATANDIYLEGGSQRAFFRSLTIRGQVLDPTIPPTITVSITLDGQPINPTPITYFIEPQPGSNQFQLDVDILMNGQVTHAALTGTGKLVIDSLDWNAQPKGGRKVIG